MTDKLLAYREEFPILEKTTDLVSNSLGPMPRSVPGKLAEYAADWGDLGVKAWARGWWEKPSCPSSCRNLGGIRCSREGDRCKRRCCHCSSRS